MVEEHREDKRSHRRKRGQKTSLAKQGKQEMRKTYGGLSTLRPYCARTHIVFSHIMWPSPSSSKPQIRREPSAPPGSHRPTAPLST